MLTKRIILTFILSVVFTKAEEIPNETFSQDFASGSRTVVDLVIKPCCMIGDHPFHSLDSAVHSLTNNTIIKIIEPNLVLNSKVRLENFESITISGHRTPTVMICNGVGAISFSSCNNVTIKGINWENCGSCNESPYPGIGFYKSSNLTILNCTFGSSMGQALVFSESSDMVYIYNSVFTHNNQYGGHGAVLQHTPAATSHIRTKLVIDRCNFTYNGAAKSVIYIGGSGNRHHSCLHNSIFVNNEGVSIYLSHHKLHIRGDVFVRQNVARDGRGSFSNNSVVVFKNKSNVIFCNNSAITNVGAIFITNSRIYFEEHSVIKFLNNFAKSSGGTLFSMNKSAVSFGGNTLVTFKSNKVDLHGGALYIEYGGLSFDENSKVTNKGQFGGSIFSSNYSEILFDGNTTVTYNGNNSSKNGACIYSHDKSSITFDGNSKVMFRDSEAQFGAVVYSRNYSKILFDGNTTVMYNIKKATISGGAIYSGENCNITFDGSSTVIFDDNVVKYGGAVLSVYYSQISFDGHTTVTYSTNKASLSGGAIDFSENCNTIFNGNSKVAFINNVAAFGGAVYSTIYSNISFHGNTKIIGETPKKKPMSPKSFAKDVVERLAIVTPSGRADATDFLSSNTRVTYESNEASKRGGAVYTFENCNITFDENSKVTFIDNVATLGGAMYSAINSIISFDGATTVMYKGNKATKLGGAVDTFGKCSIKFNGNSTVKFSENRAQYGGAVLFYDYSKISFDGNTKVTYNSNKASEDGGAIRSHENSSITFDGNSKVTFSGNEAQRGGEEQ